MDEKILADKSDMKSILTKFPELIKESSDIGKEINIERDREIRLICVCGMGGSAFSGDLLDSYIGQEEVLIYVNKKYTIPKFVNKDALIFCVSYSGNTEEIVACYRQAVKRGLAPVTISSGGKLEKLCELNNTPFIMIPKGYPPRLSTPFLFFPILNILTKHGLLEDHTSLVKKIVEQIKKQDIEKSAKTLAKRLKGKIPVIYSSARLFAVAEKWKTDINENAKAHAFYNVFPEFNHNEINSYENLFAQYFIVILKDIKDHPRIMKRIAITKKLLIKRGIDLMEIALTGENYLARLLTGVYLGEWVSYYLALEYGTDPTPVNIIEDLKKELAE
ncbi:MAG: bifunctional phosphoglucose/phosphomannose isomerase [Nanoarchaeota archaeon]|nr:bifunctional phosphoglucose/phosphomannose isomerase [Nanoarchaeota archaeon]